MTRGALFAAILLIQSAGTGHTASPPADTLFVSGEVAPAVVQVGERVTVRFRMALPEEGAVLEGPPAPVELGPVDVLVSEPLDTPGDSAGWHLEAAFFQYGEVDLAQVPFRLRTGDREIPVRLLPYTISVVPSLPDSLDAADIRTITGPLEIPRRWRWGRITAAGLILAGLVGALVWGRRRRGDVEVVAPFVPSLPPEVSALRALKELEDEALPARGRFKEHYARMSLILRGYLEGRYRIPAVESTTEEIRDTLDKGRHLSQADRDTLMDLFEPSDLVKFAKWIPDVETAGDALARSKGWINRVAPPPVKEGAP